jgi:hypothetical protein
MKFYYLKQLFAFTICTTLGTSNVIRASAREAQEPQQERLRRNFFDDSNGGDTATDAGGNIGDVAPVAVPVSTPVADPGAAPVAVPGAVPVSTPAIPVAGLGAAPVAAPFAAPVAVPVTVPVAAPGAAPIAVPVAAPGAAPIAVPVAPVADPGAAPVDAPGAAPIVAALGAAPIAAPVAANSAKSKRRSGSAAAVLAAAVAASSAKSKRRSDSRDSGSVAGNGDVMQIRFSEKISFDNPSFTLREEINNFFPLSQDDFPMSQDLANMLQNSNCVSVVRPDDYECTQSVAELVGLVGGTPTHAPQRDFWPLFREVISYQIQRRDNGKLKAMEVMHWLNLPALWQDFTVNEVGEAVHDEVCTCDSAF